MIGNMGSADRIVRAAIAVALVWLAFGTGLAGAAFWLALVVGGIFLLTAALGTCPLYRPFGTGTCRR
ncbi:YgaP family membrane protein [Wenxinia saemankumensis]|nr:DUF2892 domain-containing protein [Wenxinia saemankumensis]